MKIVYIHGLNCTPRIFNYIHSKLPKHEPVFLTYDGNQHLDDIVRGASRELPTGAPFTVVGHSLGGVVGTLLAIALRRSRKYQLEKLVTISSPLGGVKEANYLRWLFPTFTLLHDIRTASPYVEMVEEAELGIPVLSIISTVGNIPLIQSPNDGVVPLESQRALKCAKHVEVEANHFEICQAHETVDYLKRFVFENDPSLLVSNDSRRER